ncbi:MAG: hypothetical protein AAFR38_03455 [Planctomycetota bacterium]
MRRTNVILLAACVCPLPGCVFGDIRDQLVQVNANMERLDDRVVGLEETVIELNQERLAALDRLESIEVSLADIDDHLASLRRTISNIDSTIPFLEIADEEEPAPEPAEGDGS